MPPCLFKTFSRLYVVRCCVQPCPKHTCVFQIVRHDRTLEQIVFPIPEMCEYLTEETKLRVFHTAERDDQGSKVSDFFERTGNMLHEMQWQKKLRGWSLTYATIRTTL